MKKIKFFTPLLGILLVNCNANIMGNNYKLDLSAQVNFNFVGISESSFFDHEEKYPFRPLKSEIITYINDKFCHSSKKSLDHLSLSKTADNLKPGYYLTNVIQEGETISTGNFVYKIKGNNVEFLDRSNGKYTSFNEKCFQHDSLPNDYTIYSKLTADSYIISQNKIFFNFNYTYTHLDYSEAKTIDEVHATFKLTYLKIN